MPVGRQATDRFWDSIRTRAVCSILLGLFFCSLFHHRVGELPSEPFEGIKRHSDLAHFTGLRGSFAVLENLFAGVLMFLFEQTAKFLKGALRISHQTRHLVLQID